MYVYNTDNRIAKILTKKHFAMNKFLFIFTFIFGVISLTTYTKVFDRNIAGFFDTLWPTDTTPLLKWLDLIIFVLSLAYQINYWLL